MQGTNRAHDHDPAGVGRRVAVALAVTAVLALAQPALGAGTASVKLPSSADALAVAPRSECILNGKNTGLPSILVKGCIETRIPGTTSDDEQVTVSIGTDGTPAAVRDVQRLVIQGLGDFEFKVPGPALDVQGLPGSDDQPGLRKGAVLWQGFSPGVKHLGAALQLHPDLESARLPLATVLSMTVGGRPLQPGERRSGPLRIVLVLKNRTALPVQVESARADPRALAPALDAIHAALARGDRPVPGEGGVPASLPVTGPAVRGTEDVTAPIHVRGSISFPTGTVSNVRATNATADGSSFAFDDQLGGGGPVTTRIAVTGDAKDLGLPAVSFDATPVPPLASELAVPGGGTWEKEAAAGRANGPNMLHLAQTAMWETALLAQYDAYLGNPTPNGPSHTSYRWVLAPPAEESHAAAVLPSGIKPLGVVWFALIALALLLGLAYAWARA